MKYLLPVQIIFACTFLAVVLLGFYTPVKDDEIFYKLINARLFTDGGVLISLFPMCAESFVVTPPSIWLLPRALQWFMYQGIENIFYIRALGITFYLLLVALILWLARLLGARGAAFMLCIVALLSMDTTSFLLSINRPEQTMLMTLIGLVILTLWVRRQPEGLGWRVCPVIALFLLLAVFLFSAHAKSIMFMPLILVLAYYIGAHMRRRLAMVSLAVPSLLLGVYSTKAHVMRGVCDSYPAVKTLFSSSYIYPQQLLEYPLTMILNAIVNVVRLPDYFLGVWDATRKEQGFIWFPETLIELPAFYMLADMALSLAVAAGYLIAFLYVGLLAKRSVVGGWKKRTILPEHVMGIALLVCLLAVASLQTVKLFYEGMLFIPLTVVAALLIIRPIPENMLRPKYMLALLSVAVLSQVSVLVKYHPYVSGLDARAEDHINHVADGKLDQFIMAGTSDFAQTKRAVAKAAQACGIPMDKTARYVMTDTLTYQLFNRSFRPFSLLYISGVWYDKGDDYAELYPLLEQYQSSGMVTLCAATPKAIREKMVQTGDFCCMGPPY